MTTKKEMVELLEADMAYYFEVTMKYVRKNQCEAFTDLLNYSDGRTVGAAHALKIMTGKEVDMSDVINAMRMERTREEAYQPLY